MMCLLMTSQVTLGTRNQRSLVNTFPFNAAEEHQHHHDHHGDHGDHGAEGGDARALVSNTPADRNAKQVGDKTLLSEMRV